MATTITAGNATNGAAISSDNTGILELKSGTGSGTTAVTVSTGQNVTFAQAANLPNTFGFKNRIINGAMVIDQRNAGASITINSSSAKFSVDRWYFQGESTDGVFTVQQSSTAPSGFSKSMLLTVTTADSSIGSSQVYFFKQDIEGFNVADLNWGTASAATITLSFWVYSSLTGTFGASVTNSAFNRSYPFTYAISAANTWEQKTVTIAGDTTGTWAKDNTSGIRIYFGVGVGSTLLGTANAWSGAGYIGATGQTNLISTNGATFYITGVQLEKGSTATSFDYRPYGTELQLCQRYLPAWNMTATNQIFGQGQATAAGTAIIHLPFKVSARVAPTGITASAAANFYLTNSTYGIAGAYSSTTFSYGSTEGMGLTCATSTGLTAGNITTLGANSATAQILATGCEL